jgi:Uma2 family endonuclease
MWGLEYLLLFGPPENKVEIVDGRTRCAFPFLERAEGEAHFQEWTAALRQWRGAPPPRVRRVGERWEAEVNGVHLSLWRRPIELRFPLDVEAMLSLYDSFWRRDLWDGQPEGKETGWEHPQRHADVALNLWQLFGTLCDRHGGLHSGRVDVALTDTAAVAPDQCYFRAPREACLIRNDFFYGVPDLVAEVASPATRAIDRGIRKEIYRRAGVPHLLLLDPEPEIVERYALTDGQYHLVSTHRAGETFPLPPFDDEAVTVDTLFDTQWKRHPDWWQSREPPEPVPSWLVPPEQRLGLEYLLLLGHPERRREIWDNRVVCRLAFGSEEEARTRFGHFLEDAGRWEPGAMGAPANPEPEIEVAESPLFRLSRRGRTVHLEVTVDARHYRALLEVWAQHAAWDWGEEDETTGHPPLSYTKSGGKEDGGFGFFAAYTGKSRRL